MNEDLKKYMGLVLRDTRKSRLLSVSDVADKYNISIDTIYKYEQGRGNSIDTLLEILSAYDLKPNIFFKLSYDKKHNSSK